MGTSATRAKQKYNNKNYQKITLTLSPKLAEEFKQNATKNNLSQPQFLQKLLDFFAQNKQILDEKNNEIKNLNNKNNELKIKLEEYIDANEKWTNVYGELKLKADNAIQKKQNKILEMQVNDNKTAYWIGGFALILGFVLGKIL